MGAAEESIRCGGSIFSPGVKVVQVRHARDLFFTDPARRMMSLREVTIAAFDARSGALPHAARDPRQFFGG